MCDDEQTDRHTDGQNYHSIYRACTQYAVREKHVNVSVVVSTCTALWFLQRICKSECNQISRPLQDFNNFGNCRIFYSQLTLSKPATFSVNIKSFTYFVAVFYNTYLTSSQNVYSDAARYGRPMEYGRPLYFHPVSFFFFISSPNLSGQRLDVYHTSTHGVALVRI